MSSCPSVRCRNTGSGYVKPSSAASGSSAECSKKLDELMAARAMQDHTYFPPIHAAPASAPVQRPMTTTTSNVCSTGTCPVVVTTKKK